MEAEKRILVVSFGTSHNENRDKTIGGIERAIEKAFPDYNVARAFSSQMIINILKKRDGIVIDNIKEALDRAVEEGVKTLIVQPTHLMCGLEYTKLKEELDRQKDRFDRLALGEPLLGQDKDYEDVIEAIVDRTKDYDDGETAMIFMGHGTEAASNGIYTRMQSFLDKAGYENDYIATVEATPTLEDIIKKIEPKKYKRAVLEPLMVVAGDHANNDMAGDGEDSWKNILVREGYDVACILEGLGQMEKIQEIYVNHTEKAIESLNA
ncbi:MAG: sirohydrochlorin cobaltochelatase [Lachnospiraceae bacterium]|nr:sirohydrochlorin cobaltochelatase [Lachnospiraceae bacterium]